MIGLIFWTLVLGGALGYLLRSTRGTSSPQRREVRGRATGPWRD